MKLTRVTIAQLEDGMPIGSWAIETTNAFVKVENIWVNENIELIQITIPHNNENKQDKKEQTGKRLIIQEGGPSGPSAFIA
jgi:predicted metal-dependent phosphotriesterase family hydrolase